MRASSLSKQLVDPFSGAPFAGSKIPQSLMYPGSVWLQDKYWPLPNAGAAGALALNYAATNSASLRVRQGDQHEPCMEFSRDNGAKIASEWGKTVRLRTIGKRLVEGDNSLG